MSIYKKKGSPYYYTRFTKCRVRVNRSTHCLKASEAQEYEDKLIYEIKRRVLFGDKPKRTWSEAALRWTKERINKRSFKQDESHILWIQQHLSKYTLEEITKEVLFNLRLEKEKSGVKMATVNRMFNVVGSILNSAWKKWDWLDKSPPPLPKGKVDNGRLRWLTPEEACLLINDKKLPPHLKAMIIFSLMTGQRKSNVVGALWEQIDMEKRVWFIHADQFKTNKPLCVPLNEEAINVLRGQIGRHPTHVFTFRGNPITDCNTKAFRASLARCGIKDFTWHDLRHTWASWHVQNGGTLQELMEMGGWRSFKMVMRYAHLSYNHLKLAADKLNGIISGAKSVVPSLVAA